MSPKQIANLIDAHSPALLLYARQFGPCAEDLVQEAFVRLVSQRTWPGEVVPWLYRVVRNAALDERKMRQRRVQREQEVARVTRWFVEPEVDGLDAQTAAEALQQLPVEQREVIVAHLWGGLTFEQVAAVSGSSATTVFRRYQAGIAALRNRLGTPCTNHPN
jgi:RNA polymerase sigma-70 factor (ECF subfamily)